MTKLINNPLLGTDFELFLKHKETNEIVSAEGLIQGTKYAPFNFDKSNQFFSTSLDNVLAECCIPPVNNVEGWLANIKKSRDYIESILPAHLCTAATPAAVLDAKWLSTINAKTFGCDPDFNAWLKLANESPKADNPNLRSAGAHIHVGYDLHLLEDGEVDWEKKISLGENIIKAMDLFVGVPSVIQEPENDRKKLYGKAGAFRFKDYGVEYRTASNYYLESEKLTKWVFGATIKALDFVNEERIEEVDSVGGFIQSAINENDKNLAWQLIRQFDLELA